MNDSINSPTGEVPFEMETDFDIEKFYKTQSDASRISKAFANKFPGSPDAIIKEVRRKMMHPCECPFNFDSSNWPDYKTAGEIEADWKNQFVFGHCQHYTMICVAIMREKGIPSRSRCGFAIYFDPGQYEDHWVIEYMEKGKWKLADAQKEMLTVKTGEFINGSIAWDLVSKYKFSPALFGFTGKNMESKGRHYVIENMIRDISGLLKRELSYKDKIQKLKDSELDILAQMVLSDDIEDLKNSAYLPSNQKAPKRSKKVH